MFGKKKKMVEEVSFDNSAISSCVDNGYQMKEKYLANELVVANLERISSTVTDFGPMIETTKSKYIFEIINVDAKIKYREVFTGFIANDEEEYFDLPYVVNPVPYTDYFPEAIEVPKLCLIWDLNDINYPKEKIEEQQLKREQK